MFKFKSIIVAALAVTSVSSFGFTREDLQAMSPEDIAKNFNISASHADITSKFWKRLSVHKVSDIKGTPGAAFRDMFPENAAINIHPGQVPSMNVIYNGSYLVQCEGDKGFVKDHTQLEGEESVFEPLCVFYAAERAENRYPSEATPAIEKRANELRNMSVLDIKLMVNKDGFNYIGDDVAQYAREVWQHYPTVVPEGGYFNTYIINRNGSHKEIRFTLLDSKNYVWEANTGSGKMEIHCSENTSNLYMGTGDPLCIFYNEMLKAK